MKSQMKSDISKIAVVIPTYNEARNITNIMDEVYKNPKNKMVDLHILVVDDNSPDGTAKIVEEYIKHNKKVHILIRLKKEGLGAAYINGMEHALKTLQPDVIFEMDADGQHNPLDIPRMIESINEGNDFVIGSRYINGGSIKGDWGWDRKLISYLAGLVTRKGLRLGDIKDASGGFRAIKREVLEGINLENLDVKGYAFQAALLEAAVYHNFKVKEIPIIFNQRLEGESKMRLSDMLEGWKVVFKTRWKRFRGRGP